MRDLIGVNNVCSAAGENTSDAAFTAAETAREPDNDPFMRISLIIAR